MWSKLTYLFGGSFGAALGLFLIIGGFIFCLAAIALPYFGLWKLFGKCGVERWRGIVPFYNVWMLTRLVCGKTFLFWLQLALQALLFMAATVLKLGMLETPLIVVFFIAQMCVGIFIGLAVSRSFGSGPGFGVGIGLLPSVFLFILGLDETEYLGPQVETYFAEDAETENGTSSHEEMHEVSQNNDAEEDEELAGEAEQIQEKESSSTSEASESSSDSEKNSEKVEEQSNNNEEA